MVNQPRFFSAEEQKKVVEAIQLAEKQTSGEIRVFVERSCPGEVMERAYAVFNELELYKTEQLNGVLFYLAYEDHKFAVLGDKGIHDQVTATFWDSTKEHLREHFRNGRFAEGFVQGILEAGEQLKIHFPYQAGDKNELPDDIVYGD